MKDFENETSKYMVIDSIYKVIIVNNDDRDNDQDSDTLRYRKD